MKKILLPVKLRPFIKTAASLLNRSDLKVLTASTGDETLSLHKVENVDLIFLDVDTPGLAPDKICAAIRADKLLQHVSIAIVCNDEAAARRSFEKCGVNAFLIKPLTSARIIEHLGKLLQISERKDYRVLLKVSVKGKKVNEAFFCSSRNISASGILIETEKPLVKGDNIFCSFYLPTGDRIVAEGDVVRIAKGSDGSPQYGVRFSRIDKPCISAIEKFISQRASVK